MQVERGGSKRVLTSEGRSRETRLLIVSIYCACLFIYFYVCLFIEK